MNLKGSLPCGPPKPCGVPYRPPFPEEEPKFHLFQIENITVVRAPLLKVYYWESFDIDGFNEKVAKHFDVMEHILKIPVCQVNSKAQKIIFWLRNMSKHVLELKLKRIQNCTCQRMETRVGINQYRHIYFCPHRQSLHIMQEFMRIQPDERVAMSVHVFFFLYGEQKLTYEISCNDGRVIILNFLLNVILYDPVKCILTKTLVPTVLADYRRFVQPIWIHNMTMESLSLGCRTRERGLRLIQLNLVIPRLSVWPLSVEYRPHKREANPEISIKHEHKKATFSVNALGIDKDEPVAPESRVPVNDIECADVLYVVYPNKLEFDVQIGDERSLMVAVHNHSHKCVQFKWQSYILKDMFELSFDPPEFRLRPHHSTLIVVNLNVYSRAIIFKRVPVVLEVHRVFDKHTTLARTILEEIESIDDPKWGRDTYIEHVLLHVNIKVNHRKEVVIQTEDWEPPLAKGKQAPSNLISETTIFEKLFWDYLSQTKHMRENKNPTISDALNYEEVMEIGENPPDISNALWVCKNDVLRIVSELLAEVLRDLSKNWMFIPYDMYVDMNEH